MQEYEINYFYYLNEIYHKFLSIFQELIYLVLRYYNDIEHFEHINKIFVNAMILYYNVNAIDF